MINWTPSKSINVNLHPETALKFGVETIPEIWLVSIDETKIRVGYGFTPLALLKTNILSAYHRITGNPLPDESSLPTPLYKPGKN